MQERKEACSRHCVILGARIPLFYALVPVFGGINGIWWAICISSIAKGLILFTAYRRELGKLPDM